MVNAVEFIARKRDNQTHSAEELTEFIRALTRGDIPDYQTSAWLMAARINGLTTAETYDLTTAIRDSGTLACAAQRVHGRTVDKHSTGGVGDKTTLVVTPMLVACGVKLLKMSGRGLAITGGTIDKLESIPGFCTTMQPDDAIAQVNRIGSAIVASSWDLAPADGILYALRSVTATVDSIPLIASSIMSKKLAAGAASIMLDVKIGSGAFMANLEAGLQLARLMVEIGHRARVSTSALLTNMDLPLGRAIGNSLEVLEAVELLVEPAAADNRLRSLCVTLAAHTLVTCGEVNSEKDAADMVEQRLADGSAARAFEELVHAQGGPTTLREVVARLPRAEVVEHVRAVTGGRVSNIDAGNIGRLSVAMGAGRLTKQSPIDYSAGVVLTCSVGGLINPGDIVAELHYSKGNDQQLLGWKAMLLASISLQDAELPWKEPPLVLATV